MKKLLSALFAFFLTINAAYADGPYGGFFPDSANPDKNATVLTLSASPGFTSERILSPTARFTVTDNGANGTYVLELATVGLTYGGTGGITAQAGFNNLADGVAGAAAADGDILYRTGGNWTRLAVGGNGTYLQVAAGLPAWAGAASGAPTTAQYVTLATDAGLSAERVLTGTANRITLTDAGANGNITLNIGTDVVTLTGAQALTNKTMGSTLTFNNALRTAGITLNGSGAFSSSLKWADFSANRIHTIPDVADSFFAMTEGAQTLNGIKTFGSAPKLSTNTITSSTGNTITLVDAIDTLVNLNSAQTLTNKELSTGTSFVNAGSYLMKQSSGNYTISWNNPAAGRAYTWRDVGIDAHVAMTSTGMAYTNGGVPYGNGNVLAMTSAGSTGQVLTSTGAGAPTWQPGASGAALTSGNLATVVPGIVNTAPALTQANPLPFSLTPNATSTSLTPTTTAVNACTGPDGNIWYCAPVGNKIGKITLGGTITEYAITTAVAGPRNICAGPDGNLWFTENAVGKIAKITTAGTVTEYSIPTGAGCYPQGLCVGPDGNLWFTEVVGSKVGKCTTAGTITEYTPPSVIPGSSAVQEICAGPDGNLWFTEYSDQKIGKVTTAGTFTEYACTGGATPYGICAGPDGNLWFTEPGTSKIAKITTTGTITEYSPSLVLNGVITGPDGNIWAVGSTSSTTIYAFNPSTGVKTNYTIGTLNTTSQPFVGPDGGVWSAGNTTSIVGMPMQHGGINLLSPLTTANGGTGLSAPSTSGKVLTSNGTIWTAAVVSIPIYDTAGSIKLLDYPNTGGDTSSIKVGNGAGTGQNANSKNNVFVGSDAGKGVTTGAGSTFVGGLAGGGSSAVTGADNTCLGYAAGYSLQGASNSNTLIGREAGQVISTGTNNTILGYNIAITTLTTGSNNVLIGTSSNIDTAASGTSNTIQIGAGSTAIFSATGCGTPSTSVSTIAGDLIVSGTSGANGLRRATGTLSSAQLKAIFATPITAVAAPGAGFYIRIISFSAKYIYGGTAYTGSNALNLQYSGGGGTVGQVFTSTIMTGTNSAWSTGAGPTTAAGGSTSGIDNTAVVFTCPVADYATGTGTINYDVLYERVAD